MKAKAAEAAVSACTGGDLAALRAYVAARSGLRTAGARPETLARALEGRMRAGSYASRARYLEALRGDRSGAEFRALIALVVNTDTRFFRIPEHFRVLGDTLLPEFRARRGAERHLRIWSAGCASGEEPYSLAMLLQEQGEWWDGWQIELLGTDISERALAQAERAVYAGARVRLLSRARRARHFERRTDHYVVRAATQRFVRFAWGNLLAENPDQSVPPWDIILCRHVLMYLGDEARRHVAALLYRRLAPDGCLLIGPRESLRGVTDDFRVDRRDGADVHLRA